MQLSFLFVRKKSLRVRLLFFSYHSSSSHGNRAPCRNWRVTTGETTYYVFHWVSINGDHANGGCPLVVLLVNVLIQEREVSKPK